jgi:hypothetical protein
MSPHRPPAPATMIDSTTILDAAPDLDALTAERIARRLEYERPVSARAVADYLGLQKTDWVYANATRLGGRRLGDGKKPRWRFYISEVEQRLRDRRDAAPTSTPAWQPEPKPRATPRGRRRDGFTSAGNPLLDFEAV